MSWETTVTNKGRRYLVSTAFSPDSGGWETLVFPIKSNGEADYSAVASATYDTEEEAAAGHGEMVHNLQTRSRSFSGWTPPWSR